MFVLETARRKKKRKGKRGQKKGERKFICTDKALTYMFGKDTFI